MVCGLVFGVGCCPGQSIQRHFETSPKGCEGSSVTRSSVDVVNWPWLDFPRHTMEIAMESHRLSARPETLMCYFISGCPALFNLVSLHPLSLHLHRLLQLLAVVDGAASEFVIW